MTDRPFIKGLMERYMRQKATAEDTALLMRLIEERTDPLFWDELIAEITEGQTEETITDIESWQPFVAGIVQKAKVAEAAQQAPLLVAKLPTARRVTIRRFTGWAAAAAILLMVATGIYEWSTRQSGTETASAPQKSEVIPGGDRAILTLADGSTVTLDSAGNQVIAAGNASIQQHGGQLQYDAAQPGGQVVYHTLSTPRGGRFRVKLPDGTTVWLNAASSLRYPTAFSGGQRQVWVKGEAYFEVAHNARQPFVAAVEGGMEIQVLGTAFNIRAYPEERQREAALVKGVVRVSIAGDSNVLHPGEMARLAPEKGLETVAADLEAITAWKENKFIFHNIPIPNLLNDIARWYDVEIIYAPGFNKAERYNGEISRDVQLSTLLQMIEKSAVGRFKIEGRKVTVMPTADL